MQAGADRQTEGKCQTGTSPLVPRSLTTNLMLLAAFDFDETLIEDNCDIVVWEFLDASLGAKVAQWRADGVQFTDMMGMVMRELALRGFSKSDVDRSLCSCRMKEECVAMLQFLRDMGFYVVIISNANTYFIETILAHYQVRNCVDEIHSNPAAWLPMDPNTQDSAETRRLFLQIQRLVAVDQPHACGLGICAVNMCKGQILDRIIAQRQPQLVFYSGDGSNDICPSTRLAEHHHVFPRKGFALHRFIENNYGSSSQGSNCCPAAPGTPAIQARISVWSDWTDFKRAVQEAVRSTVPCTC